MSTKINGIRQVQQATVAGYAWPHPAEFNLACDRFLRSRGLKIAPRTWRNRIAATHELVRKKRKANE